MRWKLKDLLADSVCPVPEKAALAALSSCENHKGWHEWKNNTTTKKLYENELQPKTVQEKMSIVTLRQADTRDFWEYRKTANRKHWFMNRLMMSHFPFMLIRNSVFLHHGTSSTTTIYNYPESSHLELKLFHIIFNFQISKHLLWISYQLIIN